MNSPSRRLYFIWTLIFEWTIFTIGHSTIQNECEYYVSPTLPTSIKIEDEFHKSGNVSEDGSYITCHPDYMQCMVLWSFDQNNPNVTTVLFKGCWKGNGDCERSECIANDDINSRYLNNSRFCCCSSLQCNANFSYIWMPKNHTRMPGIFVIPAKETGNNYSTMIIIGTVGLLVLIFLIFGAVWIFRSWSRDRDRLTKEKLMEAVNGVGADRECLLTGSDSAPPPPLKMLLDADEIEFLEIISRGRFSTVWKSVYKTTGEHVAVKIYFPSYQQYFYNESQLYSWTGMEHENVVRYYGGAERLTLAEEQAKSLAIMKQMITAPFQQQQQEACMQYWIVTAYMPQGTLQDFLKANVVDWEDMCRMGASVAAGLAYLHAGGTKPPIVHRDVNSRNVLVKPDGTCVLCDLGFAMVLEEPKAGAINPQRDTALTEVGTVRYFAPEVLEGAVNLRDPATALKQVDVYALGLVLWEIVSRCSSIHRISDHVVPEYQPPFAKEISPHPTLEQMQLWVCKKKVRPLFPQAFYKLNIGALRVLRVLIEDCWDSDSDARITASCAHERLVSLQTLASVFGGTRDPDGILSSKPIGPSEFMSPYARYLSYPELRRQLQYIGGESTVDTLATGATSSGVGSMCLNSSDRGRSINSSLGYHTTACDSPLTLQPYQGRNPCMERNLHVDSSDDSSNSKMRVSESQFQKLDPCSPDTLARFASPALIALATRDGSTGVNERKEMDCKMNQGKNLDTPMGNYNGGGGEMRLMSAMEKGNALAILLMKSEENRKANDHQANINKQQENEAGESVKRVENKAMNGECEAGGKGPVDPAGLVVVDFRGSVSSASNDSGNCTTSSSRSGNNSANASPRLRIMEGKMVGAVSNDAGEN